MFCFLNTSAFILSHAKMTYDEIHLKVSTHCDFISNKNCNFQKENSK